MVRRMNAYPLAVSAKFKTGMNYIPAIGVELSHCGSLLGQFGANSYTEGVLSQVGRTLEMKGANVKVFDQVTAVAFPGSSGGGMFLKANGEYVGMLTQGVMKLQGFNFIVPVRRIHAFAKAAKIEWAIDPQAKLPTLAEIEAMPVEDGGSPSGSFRGEPLPAAFKPPLDFDAALGWAKRFFAGALIRTAHEPGGGPLPPPGPSHSRAEQGNTMRLTSQEGRWDQGGHRRGHQAARHRREVWRQPLARVGHRHGPGPQGRALAQRRAADAQAGRRPAQGHPGLRPDR